jgi:hypothetical protein
VTPAALTAVDGEELRITAGPEEATELDTAVAAALPGARVRRCVAALDGVGGRTWPVYLVDGAGLELLETVDRVERAAQVPVVVLVDGRPDWLDVLLAPGQGVAVAVAGS